MILSFQTYRPGQIVQTQIRLLLEEQSWLGSSLFSIPFAFFDENPYVLPLCLNLRNIAAKISGV